MPRRLFSSGRILVSSIVLIGFFFLGYVLFGAESPRIVMNSMLIGALATLHVALMRPALGGLRRGLGDGGDNFLVSQWGIFSLLFYYFVWVQVSTWLRIQYEAGEPWGVSAETLRSLPVGGLFSTLFFIVAAFTILAPLNERVSIQTPSLRRWVWAIAFGSAVAGIVGTLSFLRVIQFF